jgi:hypothetical protein
VQVIVGDPAWAADRLGGDWLGTPVKVGVGWQVADGTITHPNRTRTASRPMLTGDPRWTHRRRLVYATITFAVIMVTIGAFDWTDRQVSSQLVIGGVSLITLILTGYVFAATYDDKWQRTEHEPSNLHPQNSRPDDHGLDC